MDIAIDHVADFNNRYPGESVIFHTRITALEALPGFTLRIGLPEEVFVEHYRSLTDADERFPDLEMGTAAKYLVWEVAENLPAGTSYEYESQVRVPPSRVNTVLECRASATVGSGRSRVTAEETVVVTVTTQGKYLNYLPALYREDEMMGRFVMLFESFWAPLENQIDNIWLYFDPKMTTSDLVPWLASWIGLALDENWPEERRRMLLLSATSLYRQRGTRQGLLDYLEIYTGERAEITEHRAENFGLGPDATLGPGIALGRDNKAHAFTVTLHLPAVEAANAAEQKRQELTRRRTIESIIEAEKPAHTSYTLQLETKG